MKKPFALVIILLMIIVISGCTTPESNGDVPDESANDDTGGSDNIPSDSNTIPDEVPNLRTGEETSSGGLIVNAYPGADEFDMPDFMKTEMISDIDIMSCESSTYFSDDEIDEVISWYSTDTISYKNVYENVGSPPDKPEYTVGELVIRYGDIGAYMRVQSSAGSPVATGQTLIIIAICDWDQLKMYEQAGTPEPGSATPTGEEVDWTDAITFDDPADDYWMGGGSPPQVIDFAPSDVRKFYIKNDDQYLYLRFDTDSEIPTLPLNFADNVVRYITMSVAIDTDNNKATGGTMNYPGADVATDFFFASPEGFDDEFYTYIHYFTYDPTGNEGTSDAENGVFINGGLNYNYVEAKYLLSDLDITAGSTIDIFPWIESESEAYHHFARDEISTEWTTFTLS
ncbi:MAG: hypothetical protein KKB03_03475 [Nanoarchaeota archaeon]|nr:hypothetical protein [Nanoarchaeota archaeon]MBU1135114.1 hypothetical protein [Nanoarchaeota archaeon]MBU2520274.1 hypothetical protein [Nanoarchaeota archaeon]